MLSLLFVVLYFVFPKDLIPDNLGLLGRVDDLLLLSYVLYQRWRLNKRKSVPPFGEHESARSENKNIKWDPYQELEISSPASQEEIKGAYKKMMGKYHPDKVSHLGKELQELAHQKVLDIQKAYKELKKK